MKYYNKDKILSIDLIDETEIKPINLSWKDKLIIWISNDNKNLNSVLEKNTYEKEGIIFVKPSIKIKYISNNDEELIYYFNTNKERNLYFKRNFSDLNLIT